MATNSILGSITKVFQPAPPADVRALMLRTATDAQRERAEEILTRWRQIKTWRDAWTIPSRRLGVILDREGVKSLDDVSDPERRKFFEAASIVHSPREILSFDEWLNSDMAQVAELARVLIVEMNARLGELVREEIDRLNARLQDVYQPYGCSVETEPPEPVRMLTRSAELAEHASTGQVFINPWQVEDAVSEWL